MLDADADATLPLIRHAMLLLRAAAAPARYAFDDMLSRHTI